MRLFSTLIIVLTFSSSFGQTISYSTVKIANWTLEQFPKHLLTKAAKVYTEKNRLTGQLNYYQELNEYGKAEGLTVTIQKADYTSPASAYYYRKGVMIYRAEFFSRSTKASDIVNRNLDNVEDGPQVKREFLANNELQEIIEIYENGQLVKSNRPDNSPKVTWTENGLLDGKFKFDNDARYLKYEGVASNGEILSIKETYMRTDVIETKIVGDTVYRTGIAGNEKGKKEKYRINSKPKVTNDESLKGNEGYFYCEYLSEIPQVLGKMQLFSMPLFNEVLSYKDSLLNGEFKFRKSSSEGFDVYTGTANEGYLQTLTIAAFNFDNRTGITKHSDSTEYKFTSDSVFVFTAITEIERKKTDEYKIYRNIRITNSENITSPDSDFYFIDEISSRKIDWMRYAK
jgi:hypothetical protein